MDSDGVATVEFPVAGVSTKKCVLVVQFVLIAVALFSVGCFTAMDSPSSVCSHWIDVDLFCSQVDKS